MRIERDSLGEITVPVDSYAGINYQRARQNFCVTSPPLPRELYRELFLLKRAAAGINGELGFLPSEVSSAIISACEEAAEGAFDKWLDLPAVQGGAGTSVNMTVNEIIANRAEELLGGRAGEYRLVHPNNHVNMFQSTNDTFPTAIKMCAIRKLRRLADALEELQSVLQQKEQEFQQILKTGRTELQDAVPVSLGQEFGCWAEAVARDRWRIYKAEERIRQVNLGGTAVGTGVTAPKAFIFQWLDRVCRISGLPLSRAENMMDATQNCDLFAEVSGQLKCCAVNFLKLSGDLRLLSSGPAAGIGEIILPALQAGSSLMPGKVNPVIPELIASAGMQVCGNDSVICQAAASGQLELNAFMPIIAWNLLWSIDLLADCAVQLNTKCIAGITADTGRCRNLLEQSNAFALLLAPYLDYERIAELVKHAQKNRVPLLKAAVDCGLFTGEEISAITQATAVTAAGIPGSDTMKERLMKNGIYNSSLSPAPNDRRSPKENKTHD